MNPIEENEREVSEKLFFKIGEAAELLQLKPYVLRYWETEFPMLTPEKRDNGQRVYRRSDVELLFLIQALLYDEKYSIEGARNKLREFRRKGELKGRRVQAAQKRGFLPLKELETSRTGGAVGLGAVGAGQPIPREAFQLAVNQSTRLAQQPQTDPQGVELGEAFALEVSQLITDIRSLQTSLRSAPRSTA